MLKKYFLLPALAMAAFACASLTIPSAASALSFQPKPDLTCEGPWSLKQVFAGCFGKPNTYTGNDGDNWKEDQKAPEPTKPDPEKPTKPGDGDTGTEPTDPTEPTEPTDPGTPGETDPGDTGGEDDGGGSDTGGDDEGGSDEGGSGEDGGSDDGGESSVK